MERCVFESEQVMRNDVCKGAKTRRCAVKESNCFNIHFYIDGPGARERRPDIAEQIQAKHHCPFQNILRYIRTAPDLHLSPGISFVIAFPAISLSIHRFNTRLRFYAAQLYPCFPPPKKASKPDSRLVLKTR